MNRMKAITVSIHVLALLSGILIPIGLLPSRLARKDVVIPLKEMAR